MKSSCISSGVLRMIRGMSSIERKIESILRVNRKHIPFIHCVSPGNGEMAECLLCDDKLFHLHNPMGYGWMVEWKWVKEGNEDKFGVLLFYENYNR